jgi:hypothetical protein
VVRGVVKEDSIGGVGVAFIFVVFVSLCAVAILI